MRRKKRLITGFNVVSLADIVLLLVIFFLLSSSFIVQPGIRVKLPRAEMTKSESEQNVVVTLTRERSVFVGDEKVEWMELAPVLYQEILKNPDQTVILRADQDVPLEWAVEILDLAKGAGGERFVIATQPKE